MKTQWILNSVGYNVQEYGLVLISILFKDLAHFDMFANSKKRALWESVIVLCFVVRLFYTHSSIAIILMGKRERVDLLNLSY